jgi:CRISPR system Cascade subunit CasD
VSELLVFRLFGPLASWGEIAVGEIRPTAIRPTRSALLGLLGAALGINRADDERHAALSQGLGFALRLDAPGVPLIDYHTVQWRRPRHEFILTRGDELRVPRDELSTVQSQRHYRCDAVVTAAVAARENGGASLEKLQAALERPVFPLSLGRKACPPALPLGPEIVEAETVLGAFEAYDERYPLPRAVARLAPRNHALEFAWDAPFPVPVGLQESHLEDRRDEVLSRRRWRFVLRREAVGHLGPHLAQEEDSDVPESPLPR